jgi:peptide/nickel transport system substrate-binding protein
MEPSMTSKSFTSRVGRRAVLEGMGVGALGLAGAALLGCGGGGGDGSGGEVAAERSGQVKGATSGGGLPMNAPVIQGRPREGGSWTVSGGATTDVQFDAHTALGSNIWHKISEKGLEPDPVTMAVRPHVFTSWEVADPAGTTLVFKLHPKLFVHNKPPWNGRQFTAEDAAWNLERLRGLYAERLKIPIASFQRASMLENLTKAEAVDPLTVKVTLSKPNSSFFNGLMENRVPFMPREMDDVGYTDPMKLAGIGPFEVVEWVTDVRTVFKKNPRYTEFRPGEPHFDEFKTIGLPDAVAQQSAFFSGQTMTLSVPSPDQLAAARKGRPDANLYTWVDSNWYHLRPSMDYPPFKDYRVRQAMHLAFDYKGNADSVYGPEGGWAYMAALHPGFPEAWTPDKVKTIAGYNPDTKAADLAEAQKLMTAAGYPNGKGLDYDIIFSGSTNDHALRFQNYMQQAFTEGKVVLKPLGGGATFANRQAEGDFKMLAYTITATPDAVIEVTSQYRTKGSRNYGNFSNADSDRILDKAIGALKFEERKQLLEEYQQKWISEWRPMYVMHANAVKTMVQGNVGGYDKIAGTWFGYSANTKVCRLFFVDK